MKITVAGKQLKVGAALREYVEEHIEGAIKKYFENAISADVTFSKETHQFVTDIVVNEGTGNQIYYKSQAKEDSIYASFDRAVDKMEKQLRRYKRRLKDHNKQSVADVAASLAAKKYVLQDDGQDNEEDDNPLIIAEKQTEIETLTVADAVMRMNLANLPALLFMNKKTQVLNLVYKREDGNISWVETNSHAKSEQAA
jgi:ribosomal subunit interface protein